MNPQPLVTTTQAVDTAFYVIFGIGGLALLGIIVAMIAFIWRYNRRRQPQPVSQKEHNVWLEITWTIIPTILVMVMFWYGWEGYLSLRRIPDDAMPVTGAARMWSWLFTYENGKTADKLFVPVGQPVRVKLVAEDVLHSFYVPAFRVKRDCVPGMDTYAWFIADKPGSYDIFCAEYCGVGHADMITTVEALPPDEFETWLTTKHAEGSSGLTLLQKHGCLGCHSLDGTRAVGPSFQGIGGREVVVVTAGIARTVLSDRTYLEAAILDPGVDIVEGYPPAMPGYQGRIPAEELAEILDYLLNLTAESMATETDTVGRPPDEPPTTEETPPSPSAKKTAETTEPTPRQKPDPKPADPAISRQKSPASVSDAQADASTGPADSALITAGKNLANQNGCLGCHSLDGSRRVGPSLLRLAGSERTVSLAGKDVTIIADFDYLARALREPSTEIVQGYPPAMPPYAHLSDEEIKALVIWMQSLE